MKKFKNILFLVSASILIIGCLGYNRKPIIYLIPNGYVGWVKIYYEDKNYPELKIEKNHYLIKFDSSGKVRTSSKIEEGWANDEYFYYSPSVSIEIKSSGWGGGGLIWGGYVSVEGNTSAGMSTSAGMFIGTEQQFKEIGLKNIE